MGILHVAILAVIICIATSAIWPAVAEVIGGGELPGPEDISLDDDNGVLYIGCSDGWIKKVSRKTGEVENWVNVGGHTLGVGLLNITRDKSLLSMLIRELCFHCCDLAGSGTALGNGLDVAKDGTIYFTDATSKFLLEKAKLDVLQCRPNGRLLKYDPATRTTTVLRKNMFFANGVSLSAKEDFLVVSETSMVRCMKYWLKGKKAGTMELFMDNLLGQPDNFKRDGHGRFWIALVSGMSNTSIGVHHSAT
ncbi:protein STRICTOSIDINE SYNTHASE-LIKE 5-like [Selaginella moellendorffii]|uniref:protein STRICTOSIDINE SYNTHASE-LIKE 5-like n=1 Tax=Selaginella moellendorffii TaxID=88036 RepID=UPI000D1C56AA|nr:protein STRICTOSIDINE SYNTHASE-LIKE 5-like [Selaginella moellendorffii]|eukprot:XP_024530733.1 protein STRICTOSIDINE SYNTHASE-LIKE 5-like [Selaginella moellendorffii]